MFLHEEMRQTPQNHIERRDMPPLYEIEAVLSSGCPRFLPKAPKVECCCCQCTKAAYWMGNGGNGDGSAGRATSLTRGRDRHTIPRHDPGHAAGGAGKRWQGVWGWPPGRP